MAQPGGDRPPTNTRALIIGAVITAILALVVAVGLILRSNQDTGDQPGSESPTPSTIAPGSSPTIRTTPTPLPPDRPNTNTSAPAPAPQTARRIGDDCSTGDTVAQWDLRNGEWVCVPQEQGRDPHQIGDDCSHDGITAQWGLTPDGRWICIPQEQGGDETFPTTPGAR